MTEATSESPRPAREDNSVVGNYTILRTLGQGSFATVKLAQNTQTGEEVGPRGCRPPRTVGASRALTPRSSLAVRLLPQVAIKIIDKARLRPTQLEKLMREVRILRSLHHPHIVKLYEVIESASALFLVLEASGGELYDFLIAHGRMSESAARDKFLQVVSALMYCHSHRFVHRDLKAENLLLDANLDLKIAGAHARGARQLASVLPVHAHARTRTHTHTCAPAGAPAGSQTLALATRSTQRARWPPFVDHRYTRRLSSSRACRTWAPRSMSGRLASCSTS